MKHFYSWIKILILTVTVLLKIFCQQTEFQKENYKYLKSYKFRMLFNNKESGYIRLEISTSSVYGYISRVESYTDIPILFFVPKTKSVEVETYDENFVPVVSTLTCSTLRKEIYVYTNLVEGKYVLNKVESNNKKVSKILHIVSTPVITAGNVIPVVSTIWDFEHQKMLKLKFVDKNKLSMEELRLQYSGRSSDGYHKIYAALTSYIGRFTIYIDDDKNIVYAEGLGMKVVPE